jgi:hypothetical protein
LAEIFALRGFATETASQNATKMEAIMHQSDDSLGKPLFDYEAWRALVRSICARHNQVGIEPNAFLGWARPLSLCGLAAVDLGWNAHRIERTHRDVRLGGVDADEAQMRTARTSPGCKT